MWAMTNRHKQIAKLLLDHGANPDIKSSSGGTALDFVQPGSDFSHYLHENGYHFGMSSMEEDFYQPGFSQDRFEEEMAEGEQKRRMLMQESAANLEVDLSSLGFEEQPEVSSHPRRRWGWNTDGDSRLPIMRTKRRSSFGTVVWGIRCLCSRPTNSTLYLSSSSPT